MGLPWWERWNHGRMGKLIKSIKFYSIPRKTRNVCVCMHMCVCGCSYENWFIWWGAPGCMPIIGNRAMGESMHELEMPKKSRKSYEYRHGFRRPKSLSLFSPPHLNHGKDVNELGLGWVQGDPWPKPDLVYNLDLDTALIDPTRLLTWIKPWTS